MPRYEYECPKQHVTERVMGFERTVPKKITCPECGQKAAKVTVYKVGVQGDLPTRGSF